MSETKTLLLGFIAGVTILLGLPLGRLRSPLPGLRQFLNATAIGILIFLVWDVMVHGWEPIDASLGKLHDHTGGLAPVFGYSALFFGGLGIGLISLAYYERWLGARPVKTAAPLVGKPLVATSYSVASQGVGGVGGSEVGNRLTGFSSASRLALLIAIGIGLHNFGEGLAIGGSAGRGEIALATVLVIGFALHNATEGFGIVAPLSAAAERPSWRFLLLMGLIGGGPTFVGTIVGRQFTSDALSVVFLSLAAGSILYVVVQLLGVAHRMKRKELLYWGMFFGLLAGFITDMVVTAGGA